MPTSTEWQGWARLVAAVADRVVLATVQDMHRAITDANFAWVGPVGRPVKPIHDHLQGQVYGAVGAVIRGVGEAGAAAAAAGWWGTDHDVVSPGAARARAIAHGVVGEDVLASAPELDQEVEVHRHGRPVVAGRASLRAAHPDASGRVAVFVHGLLDTEATWAIPSVGQAAVPRVDPAGIPADRPGDTLAEDVATSRWVALPDVATAAGMTSVLVRYGTGRAIGRNGADLADLLEGLVSAWPVPVTGLAIIGHSMGGLVARAACLSGEQRGHAWPLVLTDVVHLGTPHHGSWFEKVANVVSWSVRRASVRSAPIGRFVDARSRGIKDLRFGALDDAWWQGHDVDDLLAGRGPDPTWDDGVTHHLVVGRLRSDSRHPLNHAIGDGMVRSGSAADRPVRRLRPIDHGVRVSHVPVGHNDLVRHPAVAEVLRAILTRA